MQFPLRTDDTPDPTFTDTIELDLTTVEPSLAGPKRPQDRVPLRTAKTAYRAAFKKQCDERTKKNPGATGTAEATVDGRTFEVKDGNVLIAAITSCTNTSNPAVLIAAGLSRRSSPVARIARSATRWLYRGSDRVIVLGRDMETLAAQKLDGRAGKILLLPTCPLD